jgi:serine/threonine protein kinase
MPRSYTAELGTALAGRYLIEEHLGKGGMATVYRARDLKHDRHAALEVLKPENVILQHGQPVVLDFGIALALRNAGRARMTQTGVAMGTPQYLSPEQRAAKSRWTRASTSMRWARCSSRCSRVRRRTPVRRRSR